MLTASDRNAPKTLQNPFLPIDWFHRFVWMHMKANPYVETRYIFVSKNKTFFTG